MRTQSPDTSPEAEAVQIGLLRQASVAQRFRMARALSQTAAALSRRAIARANPSLDDREADLLFLRLHYGEGIARWVRSCMKRQTS